MAAAGIKLRGRCRCGEVLSFALTPAGYKRVCPRCRSVVRLNLKQREKKPSRPSAPPSSERAADSKAVRCPCGEVIAIPRAKTPPLVMCPACQQAVPVATGGGPNQQTRTVELSANELAELAQELSTVAVDADKGARRADRENGWEHGLRACHACGELLGLGSDVCRHCGTENAG